MRITRIARIGNYLLTISDGFIYSYDMDQVMSGDTPVVIGGLDTRLLGVYTVTFEAGDDASTVTPEVVTAGQPAVKPADPVKEGYIFKYWYKGSSAVAYNFDNTVRQSFTLYALWEKGCVVSFDTGYNDITLEPLTVANGDSLAVNPYSLDEPYSIQEEGFVFQYWYLDDENTPYYLNTPLAGDITLTAKWLPGYVITFDMGIDGYTLLPLTVLPGVTFYSASNLTGTLHDIYAVPNYNGYSFIGWYLDIPGVFYDVYSTHINGDITLHAEWVKN